MSTKAIYLRLKEAGLCVDCWQPVEEGYVVCACCRKKKCERFAQRAKTARCGLCGKPRGENCTRTLCGMCADLACARENQIKREVMGHYGGCCSRCGLSDLDVLNIDHVNDDGRKHRALAGSRLYRWIKRNHFPSDLQVLCANCNLKKRIDLARSQRLKREAA